MSRRMLVAPGNTAPMAINLYGQVSCVFGNYGNVGLGISSSLAKAGMLQILPHRKSNRDHRQANLGALEPWNVHPRMVDFHRPAQIREVMEPADYIVVCIGRTSRPNTILRWKELAWGIDAVHRQLPVDIAKIAAETGKPLIYISRIGADVDSQSEVLRAHARAEMEIREVHPEAIIIRPSDVFTTQGTEYTDIFKNMAYKMIRKSYPCFPEMLARMTQPVHSHDIGVACVHALRDPSLYGKTFELGGRQTISMHEMIHLVSKICGLPAETFRMPYPVAKAYGTVMELTRWDTGFNKDFYNRMQYNALANESNDPDILGWEDLGIDKRNLLLMEEVLNDSLFNFKIKTWHGRGYGGFSEKSNGSNMIF